MDKRNLDIDDTNVSLDLSDATQAVKENRFKDATTLLNRILKDQSENIDALYLLSVSYRYLKEFDKSERHIMNLLSIAPDMGRAYQELGHLNRDQGNEEKAVMHYLSLIHI
mgnify:FL=1